MSDSEKIRALREQDGLDAKADLLLELAELRTKVEELEAELERYKQPIDFPRLRESVAHVDNSLSDFLDESIKRAAART